MKWKCIKYKNALFKSYDLYADPGFELYSRRKSVTLQRKENKLLNVLKYPTVHIFHFL